MRKRILIVTNHSYMFWQFRRELAEALQKEYELVLAMRCMPVWNGQTLTFDASPSP